MSNKGPRLQQSFPAKPVALLKSSSEHETFSFTYDNLYKCLYQRNESEDQTASGNVNDCTERKGNNLDIMGYDYYQSIDLKLRTPGGTPLYGLYRYVRPQRVWFFSRLVHK